MKMDSHLKSILFGLISDVDSLTAALCCNHSHHDVLIKFSCLPSFYADLAELVFND